MMNNSSFFKILPVVLFLYCTGFQSFGQDYTKIDKIVIDAGHGGKDPGAVGKNSKEKDIALSISLKVGELINKNLKDIEIIYTRKDDNFVKLYKRADIANKANADLFISIHCNSAESKTAIGTETFIMGTTKNEKNLAVAKKENSAILLEADYEKNYDNFDPNSTESYLIFEFFQNEYREQSTQLAAAVQNQFTHRVKRVNRGVKEAGLWVLVNSFMPSILIEVGFISNLSEEKFLMSEQGQDYLASAIYRAIRDYKESIEKGNKIDTNITNTVDSVAIAKKDSIDNRLKEVCFGVQFSASKELFNSKEKFGEIKDVWHYNQKGLFKYVSGKYLTLEEATAAMKTIKEGKYKDAFVVAFVNGERVSKSKAQKKIKTLSENLKPLSKN